MSRYPQNLLSPTSEGGQFSLLRLDTGDGSIEGLLSRVDSLETEDGSNLGLVVGEPGDLGDGVGGVGESNSLVLPDDELLLGGEGGEVHLGTGNGQGGEGEETSYVLHHLREGEV